MEKPTDIGKNRTGIAASPIDSRKLVDEAQKVTPPRGGFEEQVALRRDYSGKASPVGTLPAPVSIKGVANAALQLVKGNKATVLIDQLGERLAFERTGVRLYELLQVKLDAASGAQEATRSDLERLRRQELAHVGLLIEHMEAIGADPTALTPAADAMGVASQGLVQALSDPRTTFTQGLAAMLCAELSDRDMWELLIKLADQMGQRQMVTDFRIALQEEEEHLSAVRGWISRALLAQAGGAREAAA